MCTDRVVRERQARDGSEAWQEPARTGPCRLQERLGCYSEQDECYRGEGFEKRRNTITMIPVVSHRGQVAEARVGSRGNLHVLAVTQVIMGLEPKLIKVAVVRKH